MRQPTLQPRCHNKSERDEVVCLREQFTAFSTEGTDAAFAVYPERCRRELGGEFCSAELCCPSCGFQNFFVVYRISAFIKNASAISNHRGIILSYKAKRRAHAMRSPSSFCASAYSRAKSERPACRLRPPRNCIDQASNLT